MNTAILLLAFNRPDTTFKVFESIKLAKPKRLYIAIDGPRKCNPEDELYIERTKLILKSIDWNCSIKKLYRKENLGCRKAVSTAIDWFFENEEEGIILEDDCVPTQDFFKFSELMLEKYRDDSRIMMVSGTNYLAPQSFDHSYYFFSRYYAIWGWATWKRAWKFYDMRMSDWTTLKQSSSISDIYPQKFMQTHLTHMFDSVASGVIDTWDVQWFYTCLKHKGLTIVPSANMVSNIGVVGTHTSGDFSNNNFATQSFNFSKLTHPKEIISHPTYDTTLCEIQFKPDLMRQLGGVFNHNFNNEIETKIISFTLRILHLLKIKLNHGVIANVNNTKYTKTCLMIYITMPFINKSHTLINSHQNYLQVLEMSRVLGEFGYNVDVIDYNAVNLRLTCLYDLVIDIHPYDKPVYLNNLNRDAIRIAYLTGSNPTYSNAAERSRIDRIERQNGVKLSPRRQVNPISKQIEKYDGVLIVGNNKTRDTFTHEFTLPPTYLISNTSSTQSIRLSGKSPAKFLYLGGVGQVHKGLDLVLEAFSTVPEAILYVCSPYDSEHDFIELYHDKLYKTKNVIPVGRVDITSDKFKKIAQQCGYCILPSCSEGMSGSIITGMSFGLIPVITKECGIDSRYSIYITPPTVANISDLVRKCMSISNSKLLDLSLNVKIETGIQYSLSNYIDQLRAALKQIIYK